MTAPASSDSELAEVRLREAVAELALEPLHCGIVFRVSQAVPTGAWFHDVLHGRSEILVNPRFCLELELGPLVVLILHELLHALAFDGSRFPRGFDHPAVRNFALDACIDKLIYLGPRHGDLLALNDFVCADGADPLLFVLHPAPPAAAMSKLTPAMRDVHSALWASERVPTVEESYALLEPLVPKNGSHAARAHVMNPLSPPRDPAAHAALAELVRRAAGAVAAPDAMPSMLEPLFVDTSKAVARSARRFHDMVHLGAAATRSRRRTEIVKRPYLLRPTRSELALEAAGAARARVHRSNVKTRSIGLREIYVDCSASMAPYAADVASTLAGISPMLPRRVWIFDVAVKPASVARICAGHGFTGTGTSFDAVVRHAIEREAGEILLLTDGEGELSCQADTRRRLAGLRVDALCFGTIVPPSLGFCSRVELVSSTRSPP